MTIGIAVSGPRAGLAAFRALRAVEAVGRGAIGGFVSFAVIDTDGALAFAETQRGGTAALFGGDDPPPRLRDARLAVLMSSGPDRPEPLHQFTPGDPANGLITGHRLPNWPCADGRPQNLIALDLMRSGASPEQAVANALAVDPAADAGLIAMDLTGRIALGNSDTVAARDDTGQALVEDVATGLRVAVLHNSIHPHRALAALAVSAALDAVAPADRIDGEASLIGVPLVLGDRRHLALDAAGKPVHVVVVDAACLEPYWEGSAVWRGDPVCADGTVVGTVTREVYCIVRDGIVVGGRCGECVGWRL